MKRKILIISLLLVLVETFMFFIIQSDREKNIYANASEMIVNDEGDIFWISEDLLASNPIIWRTQGFHVLLDKSEDYGYPFGKQNEQKKDFIRIDVKKDGVVVENITPNISKGRKAKFKNTIKWKTLKKKIEDNKRFYELIKNKLNDEGKAKVYINGIFEVLVREDLKKKNDLERLSNGYYREKGGKDKSILYDLIHEKVYRVKRQNLINVYQITNAEGWVDKSGWGKKSNHYYNNPVEIKIESNLMVYLVDLNKKIIGKKISKEVEKKSIRKFLENHSLLKKIENSTKVLTENNFRKVKFLLNKEKSREYLNPRSAFEIKGYPKFSFGKENQRKGSKAFISLPKEIFVPEKNGKKYKLVGCYSLKNGKKQYERKKEEGDKKQKGYIIFEHNLEMGTKDIYGEYAEDSSITIVNEEIMEGEGEALPFGKIGAGTLEKSDFEITKGIPVTETYYKNVVTEDYILNYKFVKKTGKKVYQAKSKVNWYLTWTEEVKTEKGSKTITKSKIDTQFYYTPVTRTFSYWVIDRLEFYIPEAAVIVNEALPDSKEKIVTRDFFPPNLDFVHSEEEGEHVKRPSALDKVIDLGSMYGHGRVVPYFDPTDLVENIVGGTGVKNDFLSINGNVYMNNKTEISKTTKPTHPPVTGELIGEKVLYSFGKKIEKNVKNGIYESSGKVFYVMKKSVKPILDKIMEVEIEDINSVKLHTPVVCDYSLDDAKEWCQLIRPNLEIYQFVLTKEFELGFISEGRHRDIKGYGSRDYKKYIEKMEVVFPFDVISENQVYKAGEPIIMNGKRKFIVPMYVPEGIYTVDLYSYAVNSNGREKNTQEYANTRLSKHVATNTFTAEVSGRILDFTLEGIRNSSIWEPVFTRMSSGYRLNALPLINGDHPDYRNIGDFKKGYALEFAVTTIGQYLRETYGVELDLSFYAYDTDFRNRREVDVYYEAISEESGEWLGLVKIGSEKDKKNLHFYKTKRQGLPIFTYNKILMPNNLVYSDSTENLQRWRAEYSLPARIFICEKGFDIFRKSREGVGLFYDEDFWIKKGKLVVLAEISALKKGEKFLSYINKENEKMGFFNNWKFETKTRHKAHNGRTLSFFDGEVFVLDIAKSIWLERGVKIKKGL